MTQRKHHRKHKIEDISVKPERYFNSQRPDMLRYIPKNVKKTLEFGCGKGNFSRLVKDTYKTESWAIEIDDDSAEIASENLDKVINCDAFRALEKLPDNYFDCIIFFDILEHLVNPYDLLIQSKKKLSENGVMVISIPNIRYYRTFKDFVLHGEWDYQDMGVLDKTHLRFFTRKSILKMFDNLNFEIITFEGIHASRSRNLKLLNFLTFNFFYDTKFLHYVSVVKPKY